MEFYDNMIIISGGPGSGKSTLLSALASQGYHTKPEVGRAIIRQQKVIDGLALPWRDQGLYAELMLSWELAALAENRDADNQAPIICDRGLPDIIGYLRLCNLPVPAHILKAPQDFRYHQVVLMAPPWDAIYAQDAERRQSWAEALATYAVMEQVYTEMGYQLKKLPLVSVTERVQFIKNYLGEMFA